MSDGFSRAFRITLGVLVAIVLVLLLLAGGCTLLLAGITAGSASG